MQDFDNFAIQLFDEAKRFLEKGKQALKKAMNQISNRICMLQYWLE